MYPSYKYQKLKKRITHSISLSFVLVKVTRLSILDILTETHLIFMGRFGVDDNSSWDVLLVVVVVVLLKFSL